MRRYFTHRYPKYGIDHDGIGPLTVQVAAVVSSISGYLAYRSWKSAELKKRDLERGYEKVDPNKIVPYAKDIVPVNHEKLHRAVIEGGDKFILDELGVKIISTPEEFVYHQIQGIKDKDAFIKYLKQEFRKLPKRNK